MGDFRRAEQAVEVIETRGLAADVVHISWKLSAGAPRPACVEAAGANGGPRRFGESKRLVAGVSEKVLMQHLRELVDDGIVVRRGYQEVPPRVDYAMTEFGHTLAQALMPLCDRGNANRGRVEQASVLERGLDV